MEEITVDATVHAVRKHKHVIFIDAQSQDSSFQVLIRGASRSNVAQLQPTSVWRIMGSLGVSSTGQPLVVATSMELLLCRRDPACIRRLLDEASAGQLATHAACQALFESVSDNALESFSQLLAEFTASAPPQKATCASQTARWLATGAHRRARLRGPSIDRRIPELLAHDACVALRALWPAEPYGEDCNMHRHVDEMVRVDNLAYVHEDVTERERYLTTRKRPQVCAMLVYASQALSSVLPKDEGNCVSEELALQRPFVLLDVGGGRGDLAVNAVRVCTTAHAVVMDINEESLEAGRKSAQDSGLEGRMRFLHDSVSALRTHRVIQEVQEIRAGICTKHEAHTHSQSCVPVLVVGLHACGGLSDAIMSLCLEYGWPFCVCTCCFASHPQLRASFTDSDERTALQCTEQQRIEKTFLRLATVAETNGCREQRLAMHTLNAMRCEMFLSRTRHEASQQTQVGDRVTSVPTPLSISRVVAAERALFCEEDSAEALPATCVTATWASTWRLQLRSFPEEWSPRNLVLTGVPSSMEDYEPGVDSIQTIPYYDGFGEIANRHTREQEQLSHSDTCNPLSGSCTT